MNTIPLTHEMAATFAGGDRPRVSVALRAESPRQAHSCAFGGGEGLAAFNAALSAGARFSAVVTDFSMADAVAAAVKDTSPTTAVVMLTAYAIDSDDELPECRRCSREAAIRRAAGLDPRAPARLTQRVSESAAAGRHRRSSSWTPNCFGAGDVVWFPPGEKHWHGASPTTAMTHIAIQEKLDGKPVDWLEHVTAEQYEGRSDAS